MLCLLAKNCTEAAYTRLVEALCTEHNIMLMKVSTQAHTHTHTTCKIGMSLVRLMIILNLVSGWACVKLTRKENRARW